MPTTHEKEDKPHYTVRQFLRDGAGHTRPVPAGRFEPRPGEFLVTERYSTRGAAFRRHVLMAWLHEVRSRPVPALIEGYESGADALHAERARHGR